jgi:Rap1a immunity proteins
MFQFMRGIALVAAMVLNSEAALAESANLRMPGCRSFAKQGMDSRQIFAAGVCSGIVEALISVGPALEICKPSGANYGQSTQVIVQYIDQRSARMHEEFIVLAIEALRAAWPCKN